MGDFLKESYEPKGVVMNKKNWFELIKTVVSAALGYLAGVFF